MENIFKESKSNVINNGFLERVMENVVAIAPPARSSYRAPTLLAAVVMIVAITLITATVGINTMNERYEKYEKWYASITLHTNQPYYLRNIHSNFASPSTELPHY